MPRSVRLTSRLPSARARGDGRAGAPMLPSHLDGDGRLQGTLGSRHEAIGHLALPPSFQLTYSIVTRRCYLSLKPPRRSRTTVQDPHRPRPASRVDHGEGGSHDNKKQQQGLQRFGPACWYGSRDGSPCAFTDTNRRIRSRERHVVACVKQFARHDLQQPCTQRGDGSRRCTPQ